MSGADLHEVTGDRPGDHAGIVPVSPGPLDWRPGVMCMPIVARMVSQYGPGGSLLRWVAGGQDCDHQVPQRAGEVLLPD